MRPLKFSNLKNFLLSRYIQLSNSLKIKVVEKNDTYLLKRKLTRTDFSKACARIFSTNAWHIVINNDAQLMEESPRNVVSLGDDVANFQDEVKI